MDIKDRVADIKDSIKNVDLKNELRHATEGVNIPVYERIVTTAVGVAAIYFGTRNRGILGWALAAAGGLAARGLSGHCPAYRRFLTETSGQSTDDVGTRSPYQTGSGLTAGATSRPQV